MTQEEDTACEHPDARVEIDREDSTDGWTWVVCPDCDATWAQP